MDGLLTFISFVNLSITSALVISLSKEFSCNMHVAKISIDLTSTNVGIIEHRRHPLGRGQILIIERVLWPSCLGSQDGSRPMILALIQLSFEWLRSREKSYDQLSLGQCCALAY